MKKIIAAALFVLLVVSLLAGCTITRCPVECGIENIYLLTNTEKYRKDEEISPTPETKLTATLAKNEGEGMQFVYKPEKAQTRRKMFALPYPTLCLTAARRR